MAEQLYFQYVPPYSEKSEYSFTIPMASIRYPSPLGFLYSKRFDIVIITDEKVKVSTRSVPFLSQFFLKKVSRRKRLPDLLRTSENNGVVRYAPVGCN